MPGRIGMLENSYVINLIRFWTALIERNPGLWIDTCAYGGRRNDLEILRIPAVPLHYSDTCYGDHPGKQRQHRYLFEWIPYFKGQNCIDWNDEYGHYEAKKTGQRQTAFTYYAALGPMISLRVFNVGSSQTDLERIELAKHMLSIWRRAAKLMLSGDYYPLTDTPYTEYEWYADQFDSDNEGYILFLRNTCAKAESLTVYPFLDENATYVFENSETKEKFTMTGEEAVKGITLSLCKRCGTILFYVKQ